MTNRYHPLILRPRSCQPNPDLTKETRQISPDTFDPSAGDPAATDPLQDRDDAFPPAAAEKSRARIERYLDRLDEMVELTMVLVRATHAEAVEDQQRREQERRARPEAAPLAPEPAAAKPDAPKPARPERVDAEPGLPRAPRPAAPRDPRVIFTWLSRELRQTIALEALIAGGGRPSDPAKPQKAAAKAEETLRKQLVRRLLDEALQFDAQKFTGDQPCDFTYARSMIEKSVLAAEKQPDFFTEPVSVMVKRIAATVDLQPDWRLWEDEDWMRQEVQTRPPGSAYLDFPWSPEKEKDFTTMDWGWGQEDLPQPQPNPRGFFARKKPP